MNYHNILSCDMLNGPGLRVVLFVSGCSNKCPGCHNIETWDPKSGIEFDESAVNEIMNSLNHDYISGITISGGDPFYPSNIKDILNLILKIKESYPDKNIWMYSGYTFEYLNQRDEDTKLILKNIDTLVDGKFIMELKDSHVHYRGSKNQRLVDVKASIRNNCTVTFEL